MATLKSSTLKKDLKAQAKSNAMVSQKSGGKMTVLKKGVPSEHSRKHLDGDVPVVGLSIGSTINMDNYQSLRADVWLTDKVQEGESIEEAYARIAQIVSDTLLEVVNSYS